MNAKPNPYWNSLHEKGLAALSDEWVALGDLRHDTGLAPVVFDDLVTFGVAEVKYVPLYKYGVAIGTRTLYRRVQGGGT